MAKVAPKQMAALVAKRKAPPFGKRGKAVAPKAPDPGKPDGDEDDLPDDEEDEGGATDHEEPDGDEAPAELPPEEPEAASDEEDQKIVDDVEDAMASGDRDEQLEALMDGFEPDGPPPAWAQDRDTWDRAVLAVDPDGGAHDEPWLLVAHVYKAMGGQVNPGLAQASNEGDGGEDLPEDLGDGGGEV